MSERTFIKDRLTAPKGQGGTHQNDPLLACNKITKHYQLCRRVYPLPHLKLSRGRSATVIMFQKGSFLFWGFLSRLYSGVDLGCLDCCETFCSIAYMLWRCPVLPTGFLSSEAEWEDVIRSIMLQIWALLGPLDRLG